MEAATGVEPVNNGFADRRLSHLAMPPPGRESAASQADLAGLLVVWSGTPDSNRRPSPWQGGALPAELLPLNYDRLTTDLAIITTLVAKSKPLVGGLIADGARNGTRTRDTQLGKLVI